MCNDVKASTLNNFYAAPHCYTSDMVRWEASDQREKM